MKAGRGTKTAINAEPPKDVWNDENDNGVRDPGEVTLEFTPPAVGSGIRTLTYDPDGPLFPQAAPQLGDAYLFAPEGIIDAGEAGIGARNLFAFAQEFRNVQNIELSGTSVGVNLNPQAASSIGSLAGTSGLTEATKMAEKAAGMDKAKKRAEEMAKAQQDLTPSWLDVRVDAYLEEE